MQMLRSPHFIAVVATILAMGIFLLLKIPLGFRFGLRTWWPAFFVGYVLVWYYAKMLTSRPETRS